MAEQEPRGPSDGRKLTVEELDRRRGAVVAARRSIEMEGGRVSGAARVDQDRYVDGELSAEDLVVLEKERMYARGVPRPVVGG